MSVTDKPHSHGGMQVDFSKLNEQQRAMVEDILSRNPAAQAATGVFEGGGAGVAEIQDERENVERVQFGIDEGTMAVDGALGYSAGGAVANALTPKLEQQAMKQGMTKLAPFMARHVAPRVLGGIAGTSVGPVGTLTGLVAPDLAMQGAEILGQETNRVPNLPASPDRMTQIVQQNPQLQGMPNVFQEAMKGPLVKNLPAPVRTGPPIPIDQLIQKGPARPYTPPSGPGPHLNPVQTMEFRDANQNGIEDRGEGIYLERDYLPLNALNAR